MEAVRQAIRARAQEVGGCGGEKEMMHRGVKRTATEAVAPSSYQGWYRVSAERSGDDEAFVSVFSLSVSPAGLLGSTQRVLPPLNTHS